jgi:hypothetical protein
VASKEMSAEILISEWDANNHARQQHGVVQVIMTIRYAVVRNSSAWSFSCCASCLFKDASAVNIV